MALFRACGGDLLAGPLLLIIALCLCAGTSEKLNDESAVLEPRNFYMISLPSALLLQTRHSFFINIVDFPALLRVDTKDPKSLLSVSGKTSILRRSLSEYYYHVPFVNFIGDTIELHFLIDLCPTRNSASCPDTAEVEGHYLRKTVTIPVLRGNLVVFKETNKPVYNPGDLIRFHLFPFNPTKQATFTPEVMYRIKNESGEYTLLPLVGENQFEKSFDLIYLEDPNESRLRQWYNVSRRKAMKLQYRLGNDPQLGSWKLVAHIEGQTESVTFKVEKYSLPRFIVTVTPPASITIYDETINFTVCAKYAAGHPMRALINASVCFEHPTVPCIQVIGYLTGKELCKTLVESLLPLELEINQHPFLSSHIRLSVIVQEEGTNAKVNISVRGPKVQRSQFRIQVECPKYFKPGLPFYGTITTLLHDGSPLPYKEVEMTVLSFEYGKKWGFSKRYRTNHTGTIDFILPPFPQKKDHMFKVKELFERKSEYGLFRGAIFTKIISAWKSKSDTNLQIYRRSPVIPLHYNCASKIVAEFQSNFPLNARTFYVSIISRGQLVSLQEIAPNPNDEACVNQDNEFGHYTCVQRIGDDTIVRCNPGWTGVNCMDPICGIPCQHGICESPGLCQCREGWTAPDCSICVRRKNCFNGRCVFGNDCQCLPGWRGYLCDSRRSFTHRFNRGPKFRPNLYANRMLVKDSQRRYTVPVSQYQYHYPDIFQLKTRFTRRISIQLPPEAAPSARIVVHIVYNENEVVAETFEVNDIHGCDENNGKHFRFVQRQVSPSSLAVLEMYTGARSTKCSLRVSDVTLTAFGPTDAYDQNAILQNLKALNDKLSNLSDNNPYYGVVEHFCRSNGFPSTIQRKYAISYKFASRNSYDSAKAFENAGIFVLTNANILVRNCKSLFTPSIFYDRHDIKKSPEESVIKSASGIYSYSAGDHYGSSKHLRRIFPESWIFEYIEDLPMKKQWIVPDSITTWKADIYCLTEYGLWAPPSVYLTVVLPFYIQLALPYSIKRHEILNLPVKLFSNLDGCYEIQVHLIDNPDSGIYPTGARRVVTCLCDREQKTVYFRLMPTEIGEIDVMVRAELSASNFCPNRVYNAHVPAKDGIMRKLLVEPEGIPRKMTFSDLLCLNHENISITHHVKVDTYTVPESFRAYLIYSGDIMGNMLNNLDRLIGLPYGCGEQNMARMVPSLYVLDYLAATKTARPDVTRRAREFVEIGYTSQLNFRRYDGSFSAFGNDDKQGSTWLTAFVLKTFTEAQRYIYVKKSVLILAMEFLKSRQSADGCFEEKGKTFTSTMKGGIRGEATNELLLTAYVLTALNRSSSVMVKRALTCLNDSIDTNTRYMSGVNNYSLALISYAFSIHAPQERTTYILLDILSRRSIDENGKRFWRDMTAEKNKYSGLAWLQGTSADVETTGYAYLALESKKSKSDLMRSIRWLTSQRNSFGGFYSTQDTVIGLKALANFARKLQLSHSVNIQVEINSGVMSKNDHIKEKDRFLTRKIRTTSNIPQAVTWVVSGYGCIFLQTAAIFNILEAFHVDSPFLLSTFVSEKHSDCTSNTLTICYSKRDIEQDHDMIILEINLVSGWSPASDLQKTLYSMNKSEINKVEINRDKIDIYYTPFAHLEHSIRCVDIDLHQEHKVDYTKGGLVKVYDYYTPLYYTEDVYSMKGCKMSLLDSKEEPLPVQEMRKCPICFTTNESIVNMEREFSKLICQKNGALVVYKSEDLSTAMRTFFLSKRGLFYEWASKLEVDTCGCVDRADSDHLLLVTQDRWKLLPGERIEVDGSFLVVRLFLLMPFFRTKIPARCPRLADLGRMVERIYHTRNDPVPAEKRCPLCFHRIDNLNSSRPTFVQNVVCNGTEIRAHLVANGTQWQFRDLSKTFSFGEILIDSDCACNIEKITKKFSRDLIILHFDVVKTPKNGQNMTIQPNSQYFLTNVKTLRGYRRNCVTIL